MLSELKAEREEINNRLLEFRMAEEDYKKECANKEAVITRISNTRKAQEIAQEVAQFIQQQVHSHIAGIVTRCLATVFTEDPYEFRLIFEKKRGKTECRLAFFRDGVERNPKDETGGGAVDIAATLVPGILAAEEPDLLVGLTHVGYAPYGGEIDSDLLIAENVAGIDVLIGGHSHSRLDPAVMVTSDINPDGTLIAQSQKYALYLGQVNVGFINDHGCNLVPPEFTRCT